MIAFVRASVLVLIGVFSVAGAASAKTTTTTTAGIAAEWGLIGTWKIDCSQPASRQDPALKFVVRGGRLFHDRDWGDVKDSNPVLSTSVTAEGGIEILVRFDAGKTTRQWVSIKGDDGRLRTVSNKDVDTGEYAIRDGKFTANGNTPRWQTRCRQEMSSHPTLHQWTLSEAE